MRCQGCCQRRCHLPRRRVIPNICIRCIFGSLAVLLLAVAVPLRIQTGSSTHKPYLDSIGIGATIWGVFFIYKFLATFGPPETLDPLPCELSEDAVSSVFEANALSCSSPFTVRVLKFVILLGRLALNASFITIKFWSLPDRNPSEKGNASKHAIAWFEFPLMLLGLVLMTSYFVIAVCPSISGLIARVSPLGWNNPSDRSFMFLHKALLMGARFSALRTVPMAKPTIEGVWKETGGAFATVLKSFECCIVVPVAVVAVYVKVFQVDFVPYSTPFNWTPKQILTFAGFVNNLAGLQGCWEGDSSLCQKRAIIQSKFEGNPDTMLNDLVAMLGERLRSIYGFVPGFVKLCTVSVKDLCDLMKQLDDGPTRLGELSDLRPQDVQLQRRRQISLEELREPILAA
eukprot:Skav205943  [mRNA]  locus=scaffold442:42772:43974:+ [translate_table: standard]